MQYGICEKCRYFPGVLLNPVSSFSFNLWIEDLQIYVNIHHNRKSSNEPLHNTLFKKKNYHKKYY